MGVVPDDEIKKKDEEIAVLAAETELPTQFNLWNGRVRSW